MVFPYPFLLEEDIVKLKIPENISRSQMEHLIDEWCFDERYRYILKRRLLDHICFEPLAEECDLSVTQVKNIVYKQGDKVLRHVPFVDS